MKLIAVIGPSGSGKSTIVNEFFDPEHQIISFTTRNKRSGEIDGKEYYFINEDNYHNIIDNNEDIEHVTYDGKHYGITKEEISDKLSKHDCAIIVNKDGYLRLKEIQDEYDFSLIPVFIHTDINEIKERLKERLDNGLDSEENINRRLKLFEEESKNEQFFLNEPDIIIHDNSNLTPEQSKELFKNELKQLTF